MKVAGGVGALWRGKLWRRQSERRIKYNTARAGKIKDAAGRRGKLGLGLISVAINPQPLKTAGYAG